MGCALIFCVCSLFFNREWLFFRKIAAHKNMNTRPVFKENIISQSAPMEPVSPKLFDELMASGWRLLAYCFIRHNITYHEGEMCGTIPLRVRLQDWQPNKQHRKLLRQNADLRVEIAPIRLTHRSIELFDRHSERHRHNKPASLYSFLMDDSDTIPVQGLEFRIFEAETHIASSFIHLGEQAVSGTYCFFDPDYAKRSLGTFTMLLELQYACAHGYTHYYHGYINDIPSSFDYKLKLGSIDAYNWEAEQWNRI
jgi:leucyl-tRNA---protein transferase